MTSIVPYYKQNNRLFFRRGTKDDGPFDEVKFDLEIQKFVKGGSFVDLRSSTARYGHPCSRSSVLGTHTLIPLFPDVDQIQTWRGEGGTGSGEYVFSDHETGR